MKHIFVCLILLSLLACSKEKRSTRAGRKMQYFVVAISDYAKGKDADFAIIPQNGEEILFHNLDAEDKLDDRTVNAIDGIGIEELFYNGDFAPDNYRLNMLLQARERIPVLVADYLNDDNNVTQAFQYNTD